jgi:aminopeptidase N
VSNRYQDPQQAFFKPNDVYSKGAAVLHMLRQELGDEAFFKGVRLYMDRCKFTCVETDDFRHALEEASGRNLERFFAQWCERPGVPRLNVELNWVESASGGGDLEVTAKQSQTINADNPAYVFTLPLQVKFAEGEPRMVSMSIDRRENSATFHLDAKPKDVAVDPDRRVLAASAIRKPLAMWLEQLDNESVFAQLEAVDSLARCNDPAAALAEARVAADLEREDTVRRAAAGALSAQLTHALSAVAAGPPRTAPPKPLAQVGHGGAR